MSAGVTKLEASAEFEALSKFHSALVIQAVSVLNHIANEGGIFHHIRIIKGTFPSIGFEMVFPS